MNTASAESRPGEIGRIAEGSVSSFDGGVRARVYLRRPDRYRYWDDRTPTVQIARGAGLSYGAASFREGGLSIDLSSFDRVLGFDSESRVVEVECGMTLDALFSFLFARGLYLKVQPGYGRITVGGCIAADSHGKNQFRDGTFIGQVAGLTLFHPNHGFIELDERTEPDLFRLTCGGYGLTGHIVKAQLRASVIPAGRLELSVEPAADVASAVLRLRTLSSEVDFIYSWHDFAATGAAFGRGFICAARFVQGPDAAAAGRGARTLSAANRSALRLPLLNRLTARVLNAGYYRRQISERMARYATLEESLFPVHGKETYFRLFGSPGFHEYQAIVPLEGLSEYVDAVHGYAARESIAITLASGKMFGGSRDLLRFSGDGYCLALNFPRTSRSPGFLRFLDETIVAVGGLPNIIKDSRLPKATVEAAYAGIGRFRELLHAFDPGRLFRSELSDRLHL
jgi:decaprenylphospho-beta-D-ribofuranose 2-oxidase